MPETLPAEKLTIHDISPQLSDKLAVFPGDQPLERRVALDFGKGDHLGLSSLLMTSHLGAHVDAPSHYHSAGAPMHRRGLHYYLGTCQVISVRVKPGARIMPADIAGVEIRAPRVLFHTASYPDPDRWNGDFNSLSPEVIDLLATNGVCLIGIDTPSVDPAESKDLEAHQAVYRHDLANLEGIVLDGVKDGIYTLIALPLRIENGDASPVRAVLVEAQLWPDTPALEGRLA